MCHKHIHVYILCRPKECSCSHTKTDAMLYLYVTLEMISFLPLMDLQFYTSKERGRALRALGQVPNQGPT